MEQNTNNQNNEQHMDPQNKKVITIAGVILVIVVLGALLSGGKLNRNTENSEEVANEEVALPEGCEPGYKFSVVTGEPCPQPAIEEETESNETASAINATRPKTNTAASSELSYDKAIASYAGRTLLFGANCSVTPETMNVEAGTRVLLANNSQTAMKIQFNDKSVSLRPYHYATSIVKAEGSIPALCNGAEVATVTVQ